MVAPYGEHAAFMFRIANARRAELLVLLSGTDETFAQVVHARSSYEASEVEWNACFENLYNPPDADGGLSIDVDKLGAIQRL